MALASGTRLGPYEITATELGNPDGANTYAATPSATQACRATAAGVGRAPDIVNAFIPMSDDYAIIGGLAGVHQFIHIGKHAMISGGSLVRKDVPPFVKAAKEPLSYIGINSIGLRRRGFSSEKINEIQNIYRILFQKNNNVSHSARAIFFIRSKCSASRCFSSTSRMTSMAPMVRPVSSLMGAAEKVSHWPS